MSSATPLEDHRPAPPPPAAHALPDNIGVLDPLKARDIPSDSECETFSRASVLMIFKIRSQTLIAELLFQEEEDGLSQRMGRNDSLLSSKQTGGPGQTLSCA